MSSINSSSEFITELAACQRQRTFLLYKTFIDGTKPHSDGSNDRFSVKEILLKDKKALKARGLLAVDSSESKIVFDKLITDWGETKYPVTIRQSDIALIEFDLIDK